MPRNESDLDPLGASSHNSNDPHRRESEARVENQPSSELTVLAIPARWSLSARRCPLSDGRSHEPSIQLMPRLAPQLPRVPTRAAQQIGPDPKVSLTFVSNTRLAASDLRHRADSADQPPAKSLRVTPRHRIELARDPSWPQKSHVSSHKPFRHHRTSPTPRDEECRHFRTNPTPPDHSDRLHPPHNPLVVGSIPTGPTSLKTSCSLRAL